MMEPQTSKGTNHLQENFEDFFEEALCGFIIADPQGAIVRANKKIAEWAGCTTNELKGKRFSNLFTIGGKIYFETHLWPLLRMQGFFDEVVLELSNITGNKLRVMVNALERTDQDGQPAFIRYTILKASDRLQYEQNLQQAKTLAENELIKQREMVALREQLIAVLGHDLRNPLSAITMAVELMSSREAGNNILLSTLKRSSARMTELVNNIMDFARTRLGEGLVIYRQDAVLEPVLQQVVAELRLVYLQREITTLFKIDEPVNCDSHRIAQLLSNLLANALTHGAANTPVHVHAFHHNGNFEISVTNNGAPIPAELHERLFTPFARAVSRPSQHGLGLGLYISAEIARAHNGILSFISTAAETCFTFRMLDCI
ncbi:MAG: PAS domain-containing sensor histidine kinase [Bacteroidota bacterium]|nr:PAS domain-containing sensor histidine kinase [Bacteroidota bacterium]